MGRKNSSKQEQSTNLAEKDKHKKGKISLFTILFPFLVLALFFWAIWSAFLSSFVPRHRSSFGNYHTFRKKAENSGLALQLPGSACDTNYYWGVNWFVTVAGYGTSLSDEDYEDVRWETIKQYQEAYEGHVGTALYLHSESVEQEWLQEEWLEKYSIGETEEYLWKDDKIGDYYILAYRYTDSGSITYFNCMLCNDSSRRIVEVSCTDRNAKAGKK